MLPLLVRIAQAQAVEQIAPATPPAAATRAEQPRVEVGDRASIAQLPAAPRAVVQPEPRPTRKPGDDPAIDAVRAYVAVLGSPGGVTPRGDLDPATVAQAAAAASLAPGSPGAARDAPRVTTKK